MDSLDKDTLPPSYPEDYGAVNLPNEKLAFRLSQDGHDASSGAAGGSAVPPPAYDSFEDAHAAWNAAFEAKQALLALENDPPFVDIEARVEKAKETLKRLKGESEAAFKALHPKRSITTFLSLGKSKQKSSQQPAGDGGGDSATEAFKRAHGAEVEQEGTVHDLEGKLAVFKRQKEALSPVAAAEDLAFSQVRQIAEQTLVRTGDVVRVGEMIEGLEGAESAYYIAEKKRADITRACWAIQNSQSFFFRALQICADIRGSLIGGAVGNFIGGGINDLDKEMGYRESVTLASKAQAYWLHVLRLMEPYEFLIPREKKEEYDELKDKGLLQMVEIYNLLFGGSFLARGVSESVKRELELQNKQYTRLTHFAIWLQNEAPVCVAEKESASTFRDVARKEAAAFWFANLANEAPAYDAPT